ncbi:hypothetical protein K469DRAFT_335502 [Zopfia rhizophila CBS 207.26]|uniref:Uncharacterized protein n=1 Tax=Zopfia rhizophila CBS 207.26 TaxID=1314779 RepID=A0A6A6DFP5_9PEZI|nr:hypothetical protein K469DRAFT_335502 [Zopfia rhizophila CBS 207.26]
MTADEGRRSREVRISRLPLSPWHATVKRILSCPAVLWLLGSMPRARHKTLRSSALAVLPALTHIQCSVANQKRNTTPHPYPNPCSRVCVIGCASLFQTRGCPLKLSPSQLCSIIYRLSGLRSWG